MVKFLTVTSVLWLFVTSCSAQNLSDHTDYESLDTAQIRKILSGPISFSQEHTDSLAKKFQLIHSRAGVLNFWWGRMKSSSLLGVAYGILGNQELSLTNFTRAIAIANEKNEFNPFVIDIYITLANFYRQWGEYTKMPDLLDKCEQYATFYRSRFTEEKFRDCILNIYNTRARAFVGLKQIPQAEQALKVALLTKSANNDKLSDEQIMKINLSRFYIYYKLNKYQQCENLIFENIAITKKLDHHSNGRFNYFPILADIYVKMNQYDKAYSYADSSKLNVGYEANLPRLLHVQRNLLAADSATGNLQAQLSRYKTIQALSDTLNKRNRQSSIAYYQTELDIQTHINTLKQKETELKSKSLVIVLTLALAFFLSIIIFLIWRNFRKTKQNLEELSNLNSQIRSKHADMMIAYTSLEKSYEDNKQLIKVVAHDLRNPLASSVIFLENIQNQLILNPETRQSLNTIKINTSNSLSLIDDLLHSNQELEEVHMEVVELNALLQYCVNLLTEKAAEKRQEITLRTEPVKLLIDREKTWRVMSNLIHNAIKFSPAGSSIEVEVKRLKGKVLTIIRDYGIGIPESYKEGIFEMFSPSQRPGTDGEESFGMGLAISKNIVESFNGRIWFDSHENSGTTFFVELPLGNMPDNPGNSSYY